MTGAAATHALSDELQASVAGWGVLWGLPGLERRLSVSFSTRMTRGLGRCHPDTGVARLAAWLLEADPALLDEVLCHEAAHRATFELHGRSVRPHGREWQALMRAAGFPPRTTLPAELIPAERQRPRQRRPAHWEHRCPVCHARWMARRPVRRWRCARCLDAGLDGVLLISRAGKGRT